MTTAKKAEIATAAPVAVSLVPPPPPPVPMADILALAVEKGIDFKELIAEQRRLIQDQEARVHANAMANFQAQVPRIPHNKIVYEKDGQRVRYTYADLDQIMTISRPALGANGLSVSWDSVVNGDTYTATATVRCGGHFTSASFSSTIDSKGFMTDQQKGASANKFAMRNAVIMALGLTSTGLMDDDGAAAGDTDERITEEQAVTLKSLLEEVGGDEATFLRIVKAESIEDILAEKYAGAVARLEGKRK